MALIKKVRGKEPQLGEDCYLAENCVITGDVEIGPRSSIWFGAVIRGDVNWIRIGEQVNIQDNATVHATYKKAPTIIGNYVSIGHNAIVHGCTIHDHVLIGMGAIVMDGAIVESNSVIAAGAVVLKGTHVESGSVYAGVPAKKVKDIDPSLLEGQIHRIANSYTMYSGWYKEE